MLLGTASRLGKKTRQGIAEEERGSVRAHTEASAPIEEHTHTGEARRKASGIMI